MNAITTRAARSGDVETIYRFICELEDFDKDRFQLFQQHYQKNLADPDKIHLVALLPTEQIVGYVSCYGQLLLHHLGMIYEIQEFFVDEEQRSRGLGKALLAALETILRDRSPVSFEVTTNKTRQAAQSFYESNGFVQTHVKLVKPLPFTPTIMV